MKIHEDKSIALYLDGLSLIDDITSQVQSIQIYQHPSLGKVLVIDNEIHNVERWAPFYHETIVHVPMMFIRRPQSVLILGGGDLYAAGIALQYPSVKKVTLCDYDPEVIRLTAQHYSHAKPILADPRLVIIYQDAKKYLMTSNERFDLIIDDCFNLVEDFPPEDHIFQILYDHLTPDIGVCSSLIYRHIFDKVIMRKTAESLFTNFKTVLSLVAIPEYPGILHLLTMWGTSTYLSQEMIKSQNCWHAEKEKMGLPCGELFDPKFCSYYLYLPRYIKDILP